MPKGRPVRVLIAKPGLDGHDKGAKIVTKVLKDSGMEVIYTGIRQTVDSILKTAIQESIDVIGLSILSGTHLSICRELIEKMREARLNDILVLVGGFIPKKDVDRLKELGVAEVFRPNSKISEIAQFIQNEVSQREIEKDRRRTKS
jgi:methylmalonyl-CoA mutase C-terminal domain/subunit